MGGYEDSQPEVQQGAAAQRDAYAAGRDVRSDHSANAKRDAYVAQNQTINVTYQAAAPAQLPQVRKRQQAAPADSYGIRELAAVLGRLRPDWKVPARWTSTALTGLRDEVDAAPASEHKIRAIRVLDSLEIARKTTKFLLSFMSDTLTEQGLERALAHIASNGALPMREAADLLTESDYVEFVALNYPHVEHSPGRQLARFVLYLAAEAGLDTGDPRIREWAQGIGALPACNTEIAARQEWAKDHRLRLVVSLHYGPAGDWPESLGAWILLDGQFHRHKDFPCATADQQGNEHALAAAVDWAWEDANVLGLNLRRIEVAVPTHILVRWRPEEVLYAQRLGVNYEVLTRWSQRLDQRPTARRFHQTVRQRLADLTTCGPGRRMQWVSAHDLGDLTQLQKDIRGGAFNRAVVLVEHPRESIDVLDVVLAVTPILLWPRAEQLSEDHRATIDAYWGTLPVGFLYAYRDSWRGLIHEGGGNGADPDRRLIADVLFVWDDEDWLNFCRDLAVPGSGRFEKGAADGVGLVLPR